MSPVSNNALFIGYDHNPFPRYFARGLNVSLSTDDPCQFHFTESPLFEEYSIAAKVWRLSNADQYEIAMNSVRQSGFPIEQKMEWIGEGFLTKQIKHEDMQRHNVPTIRLQFRQQLRHEEIKTVMGEERADKIVGEITEGMQEFYHKLCFHNLIMPPSAMSRKKPNQFPVKLNQDDKKQRNNGHPLQEVSMSNPLVLLAGGLLIGFVAYKAGCFWGT
jgi:hypothetical protein